MACHKCLPRGQARGGDMRIEADKIASVTRGFGFGRALTLARDIEPVAGAVIAARVLNDKSRYNTLEDVHGRMTALGAGDIVVGALGQRNALRGYAGVVPEKVSVGDTLQLLNLGGVIGACRSHNPQVGPPFELSVLGQVLSFPEFGSRRAKAACVGAVSARAGALPSCPVVYVAGSCMNSGKTAAASVLVRHLRRAGWRVAGTKLTGVSSLRDIFALRDRGAEWIMDFTDAGAVSTDAGNAAALTHRIMSALGAHRPDLIVAETGDGIMGEYGVQAIFADSALRSLAAAFVFCANDPVGAAGGVDALRSDYGIEADVIAGPVTDNQVGARFIEETLGVPARNVLTHPGDFAGLLADKLATARAA